MTPEERVQEFLVDYDEKWRAIAPIFDTPEGGFDVWGAAMDEVTRRHFLPTTTVALGMSFGTPPDHGPQVEEVTGSRIDGDTAIVSTQHEGPLDKLLEYSLVEVGGEWWIDRITIYYDSPDAPYLTAEEIAARSADCGPQTPLREMPEREVHLDPGANFVPHEVTVGNQSGTVEVHPVGVLHTGSGALAIIDFGYDNNDAHPLGRTIEPGTYPVHASAAFGRNAALRVVLDDTPPVAWHPADLAGGGHVSGVDAGNLCVADFPTYTALTRRAKEQEYDAYAAASRQQGPVARQLTFGERKVSAVVADSGWGDGAYPAYWGVDGAGRVVQLVVDFMLLVTEDEDGMLRHA